MRCPPLSIPYATDWERLVDVSRQCSQITHADPRCTYDCAILNLTVAVLLEDIDTPLQEALKHVAEDAPAELMTAIEPLADGGSPRALETSGYVVHSLQTALYDGLLAGSAEEATVTAVNRGGDTDTIGAVAGAWFGTSQLPDRWLPVIDETDELERLVEALVEVA